MMYLPSMVALILPVLLLWNRVLLSYDTPCGLTHFDLDETGGS